MARKVDFMIWTYNVVGWEGESGVPYVQANTSEAFYNHSGSRKVIEDHTRERFAQEHPNSKIRDTWWAWSPGYSEEESSDD